LCKTLNRHSKGTRASSSLGPGPQTASEAEHRALHKPPVAGAARGGRPRIFTYDFVKGMIAT
jgi:hypothetical protein